MRLAKAITLGLLLRLPSPASGQAVALDGSAGHSGTSWRVSASALWEVQVGGRMRLGVGPRATRFGGDAKRYRAPDQAPAGLGTRIELAPEVWALNLFVSADLRLVGPVGAGANLDLAGVATGPGREVGGVRLRPAHGSLFRYGDSDRGSLNSEYYLAVRAGRSLYLRAGVSHYITGYRVVSSPRSRYLRFDTVPFIALRWAL
jgi:hypothetical protein